METSTTPKCSVCVGALPFYCTAFLAPCFKNTDACQGHPRWTGILEHFPNYCDCARAHHELP